MINDITRKLRTQLANLSWVSRETGNDTLIPLRTESFSDWHGTYLSLLSVDERDLLIVRYTVRVVVGDRLRPQVAENLLGLFRHNRAEVALGKIHFHETYLAAKLTVVTTVPGSRSVLSR